MNIGEAAKASGVSAKMIRHYEATGLIRPAERAHSGYRYSASDVSTLRFIRRARDLSFSTERIGQLLALARDCRRASVDVKRIALEQAERLEARMRELEEMAGTLRHLARNCHGDDRPDRPIIGNLADGATSEAPPPLRRRPSRALTKVGGIR